MLGRPLNCNDITSSYCQARRKVVVQRLDKYDVEEDSWQEIVIEDRHVGPADVVRVRLDFNDWLNTLSRRNRRVAKFLTLGNRTSDAARKFGVSQGRVSQLRKELKAAWDKFTGEAQPPQAAVRA
jgi:FixJ family two-component response regulator